MNDRAAKFRALAIANAPLERTLAENKMQMVRISQEMSLDIAQEAFPGATVQHVNILAEIRPSDLAKSATNTVKAIQDAGFNPDTIIVDHTRMLVLLATSADLPPAAKKKVARGTK